MNLFDLLRSDGSIVVNKALAHEIGLNEAVIYSELVSLNEYWRKQGKLTDAEWFFCTVENLELNTTIKQKTQQRTLKNLEKLGLIEMKRMGIPAKRYFKITNKIYELILKDALHNQSGQIDQTRTVKTSELERSKTPTNNTRTNNTELITKKINIHAHESYRQELAKFNWLENREG